MSKKNKYYVVWKGHKTGIFDNWEDCKTNVQGYEGALYKSFKTLSEAENAFKQNPYKFFNTTKNKSSKITKNKQIIHDSLSVDAACSGNPGVMEYRAVHVGSKKEWFTKKFPLGTNNIGEFLAIVHALALMKEHKINIPIYSDSATAISWVIDKKINTSLKLTEETKYLFEVINRAEEWLKNNNWNQQLLKWETDIWGEIPDDFGRK